MTTESTATKIKTVADNMRAREVFATADDGAAYLNRLSAELSDFGTIPQAIVGLTPDGFDPAVYDNSMRMVVAKLAKREKGGESTAKAIVVGAIPTLDSLLANEAGRAFVDKIMIKELSHVLVRPLRDAENIEAAMSQMPTTITAFITSGNEGGASLLEAFNATYKTVSDAMAASSKIWARRRITKSELRKCMESRSYAIEFAAPLEDREKGSLFVTALKGQIALAKHMGIDSSILEKWLETRDAVNLTSVDADEDDFDAEGLVAGLLDDGAGESTEEVAGE